MRLYLCPNTGTAERLRMARLLADALLSAGLDVVLSPADSGLLFGDMSRACPELTGCDMVLSVGGDGSVLRAAQLAVRYDLPVLGVNSGRLGYLCALSADQAAGLTAEALAALPVQRRSLLGFRLNGEERFAVNDIVAARRRLAGTLSAGVWRGEERLLSFRGDGLIAATPTGSTAYNLSAGGPVLLWDSGCFSLTPVCAHTSGVVPLVVPDTDRYRLTVSETGGDPADLMADGVDMGEMREELTIYRYHRDLKIVVSARA
ncbi:MAG: NAD(+)/NADH kinase [Clostridia bacterium]|nr:NAD(+)/NADH kinase [Clostridia bacterium]